MLERIRNRVHRVSFIDLANKAISICSLFICERKRVFIGVEDRTTSHKSRVVWFDFVVAYTKVFSPIFYHPKHIKMYWIRLLIFNKNEQRLWKIANISKKNPSTMRDENEKTDKKSSCTKLRIFILSTEWILCMRTEAVKATLLQLFCEPQRTKDRIYLIENI